ncbi:polyadenylate-binding protein 4-like [Neosynchiropus ocellatus]
MNPDPADVSSHTLYVGDLHEDVTENVLYDTFSPIGPILLIRLFRDRLTQRSLGYAYVTYRNSKDADCALATLNFELIYGFPIRIMWCQHDPSLRKSGVGNVFVKNLDKSIDSKILYDTFSSFGNILSCKVAYDDRGPKGYGFVQFESQAVADRAITVMNGMLLSGLKIYVGRFKSRKQREAESRNTPAEFKNVFISNLGEKMNDDTLRSLFSNFGNIVSTQVMTDINGVSRGFGFVCFDRHENAQKAVDEMNGRKINDKVVYAARAKGKGERNNQQGRPRHQGVNVYVKNLDKEVDDDFLRNAFTQFGNVITAKVMTDARGSRGFGFVSFSSLDEAVKAIMQMNGSVIIRKPLCVSLAESKAERQALLKNRYGAAGAPALLNLVVNPYHPAYQYAPLLQQAPCGGTFCSAANQMELYHHMQNWSRGGLHPQVGPQTENQYAAAGQQHWNFQLQVLPQVTVAIRQPAQQPGKGQGVGEGAVASVRTLP